MLIVTFRQNNHNRWQNIHNAPTLYFPKNMSFPAQPTSKKLSSSRNSTTLPPPSLSIIEFVALHLTTHAITSIRGHTSETSSSQNLSELPYLIILAGIYLFIPARSDRWFAGIWRDLPWLAESAAKIEVRSDDWCASTRLSPTGLDA